MAETGEASGWLAPIAALDSDVSFKMNFHKNAIHDYTGISNALQCVIQEKQTMQQERDELRTRRLQLTAAKDELTKRNEEHAAEIQSLKRRLQASKASEAPGLQGSGCEHKQSRVQIRSTTHKWKQLDELGDVKEEIRNTNAKPIQRTTVLTYRREVRAIRAESSAVKVRRSPRLAAMEEPEFVDIATNAAKLDDGKASGTLSAGWQDVGSSVSTTSTATPAALHTPECGLSPDEL